MLPHLPAVLVTCVKKAHLFVNICYGTRLDDLNDFVLLYLQKDSAPNYDHRDEKESPTLQRGHFDTNAVWHVVVELTAGL